MSDTEAVPEVEVPEPPTDRRALLAEQLEAAQAPAEQEAREPASRSRGADGRFAKAEAEPEPESEPAWKKPPASWKKDYHEAWATLDPRVQEYAHQREEQMRAGVEPLLAKAQRADQFEQAFAPYRNTIQGLGISEVQALQSLMEADHRLRTLPPEEKRAFLLSLAQQYGADLTGAEPPPADPHYSGLMQQMNALRGEVTSWKTQQEERENAGLLGQIHQFADTHPDYFEQLRPDMAMLLQAGRAQTLDEAYQLAIGLHPDIFGEIQAAQQAQEDERRRTVADRAAKAAKAAAVSVRSSTPGTHTANTAQNRHSLLREQFDALSERL